MAEDLDMQHFEASGQILEIFRDLAPVLKDCSLKLEENPGLPKRQRRDGASQAKQTQLLQTNLANTLMLIGRLLIRQDMELQSIRREDSFVFFFDTRESTGGLHLMVQEAAVWHAQAQEKKPLMPLRQKLLQLLLGELLTRMEQLGQADPSSQLKQKAISRQLLLPDMTCPYLEWNQAKQCLQPSERKPGTLVKMVANVKEFMDMCAQPSLIQKFHALPTKNHIAPWRLQLSLRADREHELMMALAQSSIWILLGVTVKAHSLQKSPLALQLADSLGLNQKGKNSKGSGKGKTKTAAKAE
eukprot:s3371_g4.t1